MVKIQTIEKFIPSHIYKGIINLLILEIKISHSLFTRDTAKEFEYIFYTFFDFIEKISILLEQNKKILNSNQDKTNKEKKIIISDVMDSLETSLLNLSELISNRFQASRLSFEVPQYNLKFLGSISKIYKAYSCLIHKILESCKNEEKIKFFANIKLLKTMFSMQYFKKIPNDNILISIDFTTNDFFYFNESIPLIFHEVFHYIKTPFDILINIFFKLVMINLLNQRILYFIQSIDDEKISSTIKEIMKNEEIYNNFCSLLYKDIKKSIEDNFNWNKETESKKINYKLEWNDFTDKLIKSFFKFFSPDAYEKKYTEEEIDTFALFKNTFTFLKEYIKEEKIIESDNKIIIELKGFFAKIKNHLFSYSEDLFDIVYSYIESFKEIKSDFFMILFLDLDTKEYLKILLDFFKKQKFLVNKNDIGLNLRIGSILDILGAKNINNILIDILKENNNIVVNQNNVMDLCLKEFNIDIIDFYNQYKQESRNILVPYTNILKLIYYIYKFNKKDNNTKDTIYNELEKQIYTNNKQVFPNWYEEDYLTILKSVKKYNPNISLKKNIQEILTWDFDSIQKTYKEYIKTTDNFDKFQKQLQSIMKYWV